MNIPAVITTLCFSAPAMFGGVLMVIDPENFLRLSRTLALTLGTFAQNLGGLPAAPPPEPAIEGNRRALRLAGVCVVVAAAVPLALVGN